jgi:uncharacterized protein involved in exopolysaccharide biosynthesis
MRHDRDRKGEADDESLDMTRAKEWLVLLLRATRRHPLLAVLLFATLSALGLWRSAVATQDYEAQASLAFQRNVSIPSLGEGNRSAELDPITSVIESVKGRDNLTALTREMHLVDLLPPAPRPRDAAPPTDEERIAEAAKILDTCLSVRAEGNVVTFVARWTDPQTAYELANAAMHKFLDTRNAAEVAIISDSIALLEQHARSERDAIDTAMADLRKLTEQWFSAATPPAAVAGGPQPVARARPPVASAAPSPELTRNIEEKRRQIREIEEERRRQLSDARTQRAALLSTYTPSHPSVVAAQRRIESLADEPQQLTALKNEERDLLQEAASLATVKTETPRPAVGAAPPVPTSGAPVPQRTAQDLELVDPPSAIALARLQSRVRKYEGLMDQISSAKLQLDLARNTFKYRYRMFRPAEVPQKPMRPVKLFWGAGGVTIGLLLALLGAAIADLARGRFVEPWQVKRRLGLLVLGETEEP